MVYSFFINNRAFKAIKEGRKKFENRVTKINDSFDYAVIKKDDYIKLTSFEGEKLFVKVLYVHWYLNAEELLMVEGTKYTLSSTDDFNEGVKSLNSFEGYTEGMQKNGIFCIRIEPVSDEGICKLLLNSLVCISDNIKVSEYINCRDKILEDMLNSEWLGDMTKEDIEYLLKNNSRIWMWYHKKNFVSSMMMIPASENDIKELGLEYNYLDVVEYGPMMVNPKYRGNNLQLQMLEEMEKYCRGVGFKKAICTIHPDNDASIKSVVKNGFRLIGKKKFNRGLRNIYVKELDN